jgi:hypothetical protein
MKPLSRTDLMSLEQYAEQRSEFRQRVLEHKKARRIDIGSNFTLYFEDRLTIQYQVQEMLRIERVFEAAGIDDELAAYNPLIPDGRNLKCTAMFEFPDVEERRRRLADLRGVEDRVWLQVEGFERVFAIANEDMQRSNEAKTSAVHFMRFELNDAMIKALASGVGMSMGVNHDLYQHNVSLTEQNLTALLADLETDSTTQH